MRKSVRKLVFLGPSLDIAEARGICPQAEFRPPIRFGDLYALGREAPGHVLIIDGVFHDSTPVWQREILRLLRDGWLVLGAASMGALRALELEPYGMIGLGTVFQWYRDGEIEGDDEVALLHGPPELGYPPLTLPLVDVRDDLARLRERGELNASQLAGILAEFKCMGFERRSPDALLALARAQGADAAAVRRGMSAGGRGLKARDARLSLEVLAGDSPLPAGGARWPDPELRSLRPHALLEREVGSLRGPPRKLADALGQMALEPDVLDRLRRESRRRWFLRDWTRVTGKGPDPEERRAFAARQAGELAQELDIPLSRWCAASALREDELSEWMEGLAIEAWLARRTASEIGVHRPRSDRGTPLIPLVLADWMRLHGVAPPPDRHGDASRAAAWLVRTGPEHFGVRYFDAVAALVKTMAASGELARWSNSP